MYPIAPAASVRVYVHAQSRTCCLKLGRTHARTLSLYSFYFGFYCSQPHCMYISTTTSTIHVQLSINYIHSHTPLSDLTSGPITSHGY
jgi:hypothetical protein